MSARPISLRAARRIVAVGAVALLVFMFFFDWYGGNVTGLARGVQVTGAALSSTGWQTFTISRWVWLLTALLALGSVAAWARGYEDRGPLPLSAVVAGLGALASALIVIRILHHPGLSASAGTVHLSYGVKTGIWLGLIAALAIAFGGYVQTLPEKPESIAKDAGSEDPASAFSGLTVTGPAPTAPAEGAAPSEPAGETAPPST
jgi:hypothetical protein